MVKVTHPEADRLVEELVQRFGDEPFTARDLAARLLSVEDSVGLIGAFDGALARAVVAPDGDELNVAVWGVAPSDERLAAARVAAQKAADAALRSALEDALTRDQAAARLGISPQAVSKRLLTGGLVALSRGRAKYLPAWQFHEDGVLPGLREIIAAYPGSPLALTTWATSRSSDLDGQAPASVAAQPGGSKRVLGALDALTAAAW